MEYKIWEINGLSLELDLGDVDVLERYENALELMQEERKAIPKDAKASQNARATCEIIWRTFDRIFGEGTAEKIFDGVKMNPYIYLDVLADFVDFATEQKVKDAQKLAERTIKYIPNRQQRRQKK